MSDHYILQGKEAIPVDLLDWARWYEKADRRVAVSNVGDTRISTVFLGLDHNFLGGPPLIFETMVFGGKLDGYQDRYTTWKQAEDGHAAMVARVDQAEAEATSSQ